MVIAELGMSYTEFGLIMAISSAVGGLLQVFFSTLSRKVTRHVLLGLGNALLSAGTFITALARNTLHFLLGRVVTNVGVAPQHPMGVAIISDEFDDESVGKAIGIHFGFAYVGNLVGPLLMTALAAVVGWRGAFLIFSIPIFLVGLSVILCLQRAGVRARNDKNGEGSMMHDFISIMKTEGVLPVVLACIMTSGGIDLGIITTYTPIFLADALRLEVYERGMFYTVLLLGGIVGPVAMGRFAKDAGLLKEIVFCVVLSTFCVFLLPLYSSASTLLLVHLFVLGFTSFSLPTLMQTHLVKITSGFRRDLAVGIYFTVGFGFGSLWTAVVGWTIDVYASFTPAFILMGTLGLLASFILAGQMRRFRN